MKLGASSMLQSWTWIGFMHGLDWVRSFVLFIVFPKDRAPSSSVLFH